MPAAVSSSCRGCWRGSLPASLTLASPAPLLSQAGAVRALLAEAAATVHPLVHAQRTVGAGAAAAGLFALGGYLDQEKQRQEQAAERQRVWAEEQWGGGG